MTVHFYLTGERTTQPRLGRAVVPAIHEHCLRRRALRTGLSSAMLSVGDRVNGDERIVVNHRLSPCSWLAGTTARP